MQSNCGRGRPEQRALVRLGGEFDHVDERVSGELVCRAGIVGYSLGPRDRLRVDESGTATARSRERVHGGNHDSGGLGVEQAQDLRHAVALRDEPQEALLPEHGFAIRHTLKIEVVADRARCARHALGRGLARDHDESRCGIREVRLAHRFAGLAEPQHDAVGRRYRQPTGAHRRSHRREPR